MIPNSKKDVIESLVGLVLVFAGIGAAVYLLDFENIQATVAGAGVWAPIILILAKAATIIFAPLTGSPLYPLAGVLFGFWEGVIYIAIGDMLGAVVSFYISRKFGQRIVEKLLAKKNMPTAEKVIQTIESPRGFLFARVCFAAMPEIVSYSAGLTHIPFWRFFIIHNLVGLIPTVILVGSGGILLSFHDPIFVAGFLALGLFVVFLGGWLFFRFSKQS